MAGKSELEGVRKQLRGHHQEHLLAFWQELSDDQRRDLLHQIRVLDFGQICRWVEQLVKNEPPPPIRHENLVPPPSYSPGPRDDHERRKYMEAIELGENLIAAGRVAGLTVAGGQGTRLGFEGPKGDFPLSPLRHKTLFQLFAETVATVCRRYRTTCPWYIMTSPMNHAQTVEIFKNGDYYGLDPRDVFLFQQGTLPNFAFDGRILLADKSRIAESPDGHGGCIKALARSGALADMKRRGIEYISYWQVDNPLVRLFDPLFIGLHVLDGAQMSSKAVIKTSPKEKVGNFCLVDGKLTVIEYSDLPDELAERRNPDGSLVFQLGSIAIHAINTRFVEELNTEGYALPLHRAVKKIPHIDANGNYVEPEEPNGIKLESFIFDALPIADASVILQIDREEQFAPTKNATGEDSVETTRRMMVERAARWLESAGIEVPRRPAGSADCTIEMTPSFALDQDDVKAKRDQVAPLKPGDEVYLV